MSSPRRDPARPDPRRSDWRDTVRVATDVALLGIAVVAAALPVVTAGAAVATGSAALHHFLQHDRWLPARDCLAVFRRGLLPGVVAGLLGAVAVLLLVIDLLALRRGVVPGGGPMIAVTAVLAAVAVGFAGLVVVLLGVRGGRGWRDAVRGAAALTVARPAVLPAAAGVLALAALLGALVHPALVPALAGYALFALHIVVRRLRPSAGPAPDTAATPAVPAQDTGPTSTPVRSTAPVGSARTSG